ncbi:uncharacterized protein LOC117180801 isoform X2 [Belonocnema kinseyi]|uniref:uncharacterized protein LOC117180801 isoform X2 n=1 Tax=Belonocnema kinseyi TaxID=2817044 RepID=UPI00143D596D|nr:uncharacterized protein LOC117180801 isoform X2 [Belonocnema kinseyi]
MHFESRIATMLECCDGVSSKRIVVPYKCRISQVTLFFVAALLARAHVRAQDLNTNSDPPAKVEATSGKEVQTEQELICPRSSKFEGRLSQFLNIPCDQLADCSILGPDQRCCKGYCKQGIPAPPKEPTHEALNGFSRWCPKQPIPELLPITRCTTDADCEQGRRICCPDKKDQQLYCRTAAPNWVELPFRRTHAPLQSLNRMFSESLLPGRSQQILQTT